MANGVRWQLPLRGTLHLARTNVFMLGGGKAMMNAYYATAEKLGVQVRYETEVCGLVVAGRRIRSGAWWSATASGRRSGAGGGGRIGRLRSKSALAEEVLG